MAESTSGFAKVPNWLLELKPPGNAVLVYATLYQLCDWTTGYLEGPTHTEIGERVGLSRATVKRMMNWLRDNGAVSWEPNHDGQLQRENSYVVTVDSPGLNLSQRSDLSHQVAHFEPQPLPTDRGYTRCANRRKPVDIWAGGDDVYASPMEVVA